MRAIRVSRLGGPEVLTIADIDDPQPGADEALVRLEAIGVNFIDVYFRMGLYKKPLPFTPGSEAAGTVVAIGENVRDIRVGDRVASTGFAGAYADLATARADQLVVLPEGITAREGAAAMLQGMTAHYLATSTHALQPGDRCLIHAAAGGVGLLLAQIARARGAFVIGTVSTDAKAALAREAGCHEVVLYTRQDFVAEVRRITGGAGVDVVYDSVGATTFNGSLDCLRPRGLLALFGQSSGPVPPFDPGILNPKGSLYLTRPTLAHYVATPDELRRRAGDVLGWIRDGSLRLRIDRDVPLADAREAHRALQARETTGKVLLVPN
ncbi:MAG: Alcohol dehydrogenase zinc-binding domain protein [Gemmatimonadetes bacterium]|jgi:NADPH2:quinone reductase|nr:Alcohol dehydrogenase zinc-binding domain protein [Gemmatimonadota bacterium]